MNFEEFETAIFSGRYGYSTTISKKKKDSEDYESAFIDVYFKKGVKVEDRSKIRVKKSWLSFNTNEKTNKHYLYLFISEFDLLGKIPNKSSDNSDVKKEVDAIIEQMNSVKEEQQNIDQYLK